MLIYRLFFFIAVVYSQIFCLSSALAFELTEERTYTVTHLHLPESCRTRDAELCTRFSSFFASRFDRRAIEYLSSMEFDDADSDDLSFNDVLGEQEITVSMEHLHSSKVLTVCSEISSVFMGERSHTFESMNIDETSGRPIGFKDLFEDPDLAAMICARKFEQEFLHEKTALYEAIVASLELGPHNFVLKSNAIEIFFAPNTAKQGDRPASLRVTVKELETAGPKDIYFQDSNR